MTITLEIDCEVDGEEPSYFELEQIVAARLASVWLSEEVNEPDKWALLIQAWDLKITNNQQQPDIQP